MDDMQALAQIESFVHAGRSAVSAGDSVIVHGGSDLGPGYNDDLYCLDRSHGRRRWGFGGRERSFDLLSPVAVDAQRVFVGRNNGLLYALGREDGAVAWTWRHGTDLAVPCLAGGVVLVGDAAGFVRRIDPATGRVLGERRCSNEMVLPRTNGSCTWLSHIDGAVSGLDPGTLTERWKADCEARLAWPAVGIGDAVVACTRGRRLIVLAAADGAVRDSYTAAHGALLPPVGENERIWTASAEGERLHLLAPGWEPGGFRLVGPFAGATSLAWCDGNLYADTPDGIVRIAADLGGKVQRIYLPGRPQEHIAVLDRELYAFRVDGHRRQVHCIDLAWQREVWTATIGAWGLT